MTYIILPALTLLILNCNAQDWILNPDGSAPCDTTFTVDPANNNDPETYATFTSDPRGQNSIISGDAGNEAAKWRMVSKLGRPLFDWPFILNVAANQWQYDATTGKSTLSISMRAMCELTSQCDQFYSFSLGNNKYVSFATDFDGYISTGSKSGVQMYPQCGSSTLPTGDPSTFLSSISKTTAKGQWDDIRKVLAGGSQSNWNVISSKHNGENFPVSFIFENDPIGDTLSITFKTNTFSNGITCEYNTAIDTTQGIKWFITPDWPSGADEIQLIRGFYFNANTEYPKKPLTVDPCSAEWTEEMEQEAKSELNKMIAMNNGSYTNNSYGLNEIFIVFSVVISLIGMISILCWNKCYHDGNGLKDTLKSKEEYNPLLNNKV